MKLRRKKMIDEKLIVLVLLNIFGFILMGLDKLFALKKKRRISEKNLIAIAVLGGSVGTLIGMQVFHHKVRKPLFLYGIPVILTLQLYIYYHFFIK
jgi:uncharacterized membrane protein YsdA (DUF1294 family)